MSEIEYRQGNELPLTDVVDLYRDSTLGERRPIDDDGIVADMLRHANLVVTAWDAGRIVGIARSLTDFSYVGYLADLAVRMSYQHRGIGTELIWRTRDLMGSRSMLVLLAAPKATDYYPKVGFRKHESAWVLGKTDSLSTNSRRQVAKDEDAV
jgi:N-acetylglutamate synthase-like GNAT family acetyltransferase